MADDNPFTAMAGGVRVELRLQPSAKRSGIEGLVRLADGNLVLKARVSEPPDGGRANAALVKLLAKTWRIPKSAIALVAGQSSRRKTLQVAGDPEELLPRFEAWLAGLGQVEGR